MVMRFNCSMLCLTLIAACCGSIKAQELVSYNLQGAPGTQVSSAATFQDPCVTALPVTRSANITPSAGANSISSSNWSVGEYYSFGFTVNAGFQANLSSLEIGSRSSSSGPRFFVVYSSVDNFTTALATVEHVGTTFSNTIVDLSSLTGLTGTVEFRYRVDVNERASGTGETIATTGTARITNYFIPTDPPPNVDSGGFRIKGTCSPIGGGASVVGAFVQHFGYTGAGSPIDSVKSLHNEGASPQTLTYDNLINTSRGINGVVFDIQDLGDGGSLSASDFSFQVSPTGAFDQGTNPPSGWSAGPAPVGVSVVPGSPDRVTIEWANNSITNRWLRVTILANANTGLSQPEVYYIGHLLGETTGPDVGGFYTVAFGDITPIRSQSGATVNSGSTVDIDKNGTVSFADISAMRTNVGAQLPNITVP